MKEMIISLQKYRANGEKILTGRDEGKRIRETLKLDKIDKEDITVTIDIPGDILSLNSSYFLGLFQKSIILLGEEKFRKKYIFKCERKSIVDINVEDGIQEALNNANALGGK
ncbi:MAG: hypothetical protein ACI4ON_00515 [Clostridia bacterium]